MRNAGNLTLWDDDKGFGFIAGDNGQRIFVHISSIKRSAIRPTPGARVTYLEGIGNNGRPAAVSVVLLGAPPRQVMPKRARPAVLPSAIASLLRIGGAVLIVGAAYAATRLVGAPNWLPIAYLVLGVVSIAFYWADKRAAEADEWRTRESTLHGIDLFGGIAGGLVAQQLLRHKTRKQSFAAATLVIALLHLALLGSLTLGLWSLPDLPL